MFIYVFVYNVQSFHITRKSIVILFIPFCEYDILIGPSLIFSLGKYYREYEMFKLRTSKLENPKKENKTGLHYGIYIVLFFLLSQYPKHFLKITSDTQIGRW